MKTKFKYLDSLVAERNVCKALKFSSEINIIQKIVIIDSISPYSVLDTVLWELHVL